MAQDEGDGIIWGSIKFAGKLALAGVAIAAVVPLIGMAGEKITDLAMNAATSDLLTSGVQPASEMTTGLIKETAQGTILGKVGSGLTAASNGIAEGASWVFNKIGGAVTSNIGDVTGRAFPVTAEHFTTVKGFTGEVLPRMGTGAGQLIGAGSKAIGHAIATNPGTVAASTAAGLMVGSYVADKGSNAAAAAPIPAQAARPVMGPRTQALMEQRMAAMAARHRV